ncbi:MAG: 3-hydroxyacyl-CoA dehydrogenase NAD-binding domain-containing protein [Bacteroidota bacterium]
MIQYKKDTDNIVTLTLDMDQRNINIINHRIGQAFVPILQHLKDEKAKGQLRGIIITSAKKNFLVGGDLDHLYNEASMAESFEFSQTLQDFFRDLERPGVPVVAAINGTTLGTGFCLALACHHRIVLNRPDIRLGHPEVTLGLMPGSGGVIRLMWLLGIEKAFAVLTSGRRYRPEEALAVGIIDELASTETEMMERARLWLKERQEGRRRWDTADGRIPEGTARDHSIARKIQILAAGLIRDNHGNYPAPRAILSTLSEGSKVDFDTACRIESRYFAELVRSKEARNMTKAFWFDFQSIKSGERRPKGFGRFRARKVGIIGAGMMGSGIALTCLLHGLEVILKDVSKPIADRGKEYTLGRLKALLQSGTITAEDEKNMLARIHTSESSEDFISCDLVIEAVFENAMVKTKVIKEAEMFMDQYAFLASNTVSIPITELGKNFNRSDNFVGLHFFAPVDEVPLVEIVKGQQTSEETIARAYDFVRTIGKTPIIVKDTWGFYVSRVRNTFLLEGIQMLKEGYSPALIENLSLQAGMPIGALALADSLSLPMVLKYEGQAAAFYGNKYIQHPAVGVLTQMVDELGRPGKTKLAGFYDYQIDGSSQLWQQLGEHFPVQQQTADRREIIERFLFAQVIEAVWCMQEGIIQTVAEANLGSIYGWGFPSYKGGVLQYVNDYGPKAFIDRCRHYESLHGPRFKVPSLLRKQVEKGELPPKSNGTSG